MRVLVVGASGFLGRNFLLASDPSWTVDAVYRTATDFPTFLTLNRLRHVTPHRCDLAVAGEVRMLAGRLPERFDTILFLAANADPGASASDPIADMMSGPAALVTLLSAFQCDRLVYFSSGAVYDGLRGEVGPKIPVAPRLPYAISKLACERYIEWFHHTGRLGGSVILRLFGAYGPHEPSRKIYTRLVRWATAGAQEPFKIRGDGRNLIDAMYVADVVRGIQKILGSDASDKVVDFATGVPLTINDLVDRAAHIFDVREPRVEHVGTASEYNEFFVSGQQMERLFGFTSEVSLDRGLLLLREHLATVESCR